MRVLEDSRSNKGKDITYVNLKESMEKKDCPICYLLLKSRNRWIDSLLYEHVTDSALRDKIRETGFCSRHIWAILNYSEKHLSVDGLGVSIIMQDVLENRLSAMSNTAVENVDWGKECILC